MLNKFMKQYIDKSAVVAEIDNILNYIDEHWDTDYAIGAQRFADKLQDAIDTIEVKEVDLQTELGNYIEHYRNRETGYTMLGIAEHFFELGLKAQKGE